MALAWSGLLYAFVSAQQVNVNLGEASSGLVSEGDRQHLLEVGTRLWQAARRWVSRDIPGGPSARAVAW